MSKITEISLIILAGAVVAIADILIKKVVLLDAMDFRSALKNPLMILVVLLYLVQIIVFIYLFTTKSYLSIVGIGQAAIYTIMVIGSGALLFSEVISLTQTLGIALAVMGVILMNL